MIKYILLFLSFVLPSFAEKTICLNMIVKDESHVITRCLESVKNHIDYWVIVDTGSTDGTQKIIKEFLKDIPGELYERPWVDFGHNRDEALSLAFDKGDYILFMDADEKLVLGPDFVKPALDKDYYYISVRDSDTTFSEYHRFFLVNNHLKWAWRDVLHEYLLVPSDAKTSEVLKTMRVFTDSDGNRSKDPKKYYKDAAVLEKALEKDPSNARYVFYLAQSYHNAEEYELAIKNYERRASMKGVWDKEVFWSLYTAGKLQEHLKKPQEIFLKNYSKAFESDQTRAEPLYRLADYFFKNKTFVLGYIVAKAGLSILMPSDGMYVEHWIYHYGISLQYANCAFMLGKYDEASEVYEKLLKRTDLPEDARKLTVNNLLCCKGKQAK